VPIMVPVPEVVQIGPHLTTQTIGWKLIWDTFWQSLTIPTFVPITPIVSIGPHFTTETTAWKTTWDDFWKSVKQGIAVNGPIVVSQMQTHLTNVGIKNTEGIAVLQKAWDAYYAKNQKDVPIETKKVEESWETHRKYFATWDDYLPKFYASSWVKFFDTLVEGTKTITAVTLPKFWEDNKTAILLIVGNMIPGLGTIFAKFIPELGPVLGGFFSFMETGWAAWSLRLSTKIGSVVSEAKILINEALTEATTMGNLVTKAVKAAKADISGVLTSIGEMVTAAAKAAAQMLSGGAGAGSMPAITGFANGGIIDKHSIVQLAENGREAAIPLSGQAMLPFAQAIADAMPNQQSQGNGGLPVVYVHTLIADDAGLKMLERKLNIVRLNENGRRGQS
jgi:hypothetical protein